MQRFADRGFVTVNGVEVLHLKSANISTNENLTRADHMTRNRRSSGYKYGNKHIQIALEKDIEWNRAQIDLSIADPEADVNMVFVCGGERYTVKGVAQSDMSLNSSVGDSSKSSNYEALDIVNENGDSVNTDIVLG